jgi:hypothetical protein
VPFLVLLLLWRLLLELLLLLLLELLDCMGASRTTLSCTEVWPSMLLPLLLLLLLLLHCKLPKLPLLPLGQHTLLTTTPRALHSLHRAARELRCRVWHTVWHAAHAWL